SPVLTVPRVALGEPAAISGGAHPHVIFFHVSTGSQLGGRRAVGKHPAMTLSHSPSGNRRIGVAQPHERPGLVAAGHQPEEAPGTSARMRRERLIIGYVKVIRRLPW